MLGLLFLLVAPVEDTMKRPEPGEVAPGFALPASTGTTIKLGDLRGKTVVLAFFPKAFTAG